MCDVRQNLETVFSDAGDGDLLSAALNWISAKKPLDWIDCAKYATEAATIADQWTMEGASYVVEETASAAAAATQTINNTRLAKLLGLDNMEALEYAFIPDKKLDSDLTPQAQVDGEYVRDMEQLLRRYHEIVELLK